MPRLKTYFGSSIGKKLWIGVTGLALSGFVLGHMAGNLLMFVSDQAYNEYGHGITHGILYPAIEIGLLLALVIHVTAAIRVTLENRRARPSVPGSLRPRDLKAARFASRSMILTGLLVFAFVILHLKIFRFGNYYAIDYGNGEIRDLYRLMVEEFHEPITVVWYVFSMIILGLHLSHGFAATFQSLGFASVRRAWVRYLGYAVAGTVAIGFMSQPIFIWFSGGN